MALANLSLEEGLAVPPDDSFHYRVVGIVSLNQPPATNVGAAGTACHLVQELEGTLPRAGVRALG